jgi:hypothetical protein
VHDVNNVHITTGFVAKPRHPIFSDDEADQRFDEIHEALASVGVCDGTGGCEYTRVKQQWLDAGRPSNVAAFIEHYSNLLP